MVVRVNRNTKDWESVVIVLRNQIELVAVHVGLHLSTAKNQNNCEPRDDSNTRHASQLEWCRGGQMKADGNTKNSKGRVLARGFANSGPPLSSPNSTRFPSSLHSPQETLCGLIILEEYEGKCAQRRFPELPRVESHSFLAEHLLSRFEFSEAFRHR